MFRFSSSLLLYFAISAISVAQPYTLTLSGASPSGFWTLLGAGLDTVMKEAYPGSTITYQTSGGGFANIELVSHNKVPLGIAHDAELKLALQGAKPFSQAVTNLTALAVFYNWAPMQMITNKSFADTYKIRSFEDLAKVKPPLRIAFNKRGNITELIGVKMFQAAGISLADIEKWGGTVIYAASSEQGDLIKDKRIDMFCNGVFARSGFILQAGNSVPLVSLPFSEQTIDRTASEFGMGRTIVKGGTYEWQSEPVPTVALGAVLFANKDLDDTIAYSVVKALYEHFDQFRKIHSTYKDQNPSLLVAQKALPFHPGATKFYREVGLMK